MSRAKPLVRSLARELSSFFSEPVSQPPSGALGLWYAGEYLSSPVVHVPNTLASGAVSASIVNGYGKALLSSLFWSVNNVDTRVASATTDPDGGTNAIQVASAAFGYSGTNITFPSTGSYTMRWRMRSRTGISQTVRSWLLDGNVYQTNVATTSWQTFTHTFTGNAGATQIMYVTNDPVNTAFDVDIYNVEIFAGASAPAVTSGKFGHLLLGRTSGESSTQPTRATPGLNFSSQGYGLIQFPSATSYSTITFGAVVEKVANGNSLYSALLSALVDYEQLTLGESTDRQAFIFGTWQKFNTADAVNLSDSSVHFICFRFNGTTMDIFVDDALVYTDTASPSPTPIADFVVAKVAGGFQSDFLMHAMALYPTALSNSAVTQLRQHLEYKSRLYGAGAVDTAPALVIGEGDSLTANLPSFFTAATPATTKPNYAIVMAKAGADLDALNARGTQVDSLLLSGRTNVLHILIGTNDLRNYASAAAYTTALGSYISARKSAASSSGKTLKVVVSTILARGTGAPDDATHNSFRATANTTIRGWVGTTIDACSDLAADATIGTDAAALNVTYFSDGIHMTDAADAIAAPILTTALNSVL